MEDNNRVNRRSRPRPYDLRRKVLLKNFLREQMINIPLPETEVESNTQTDDHLTEDSSVSIHVDEDLTKLNEDLSVITASKDEQSNSNTCVNTELDSLVTNSKDDVSSGFDNATNIESSSNSTSEAPLFKFSGLVKLKKESKKKIKGILKAKDVCKSAKKPMKTRSFKSSFERVFYGRKRPTSESASSNPAPRKSPRSLFSLFKHRKEQRNLKELTKSEKPPSVNSKKPNTSPKHSTISQSVQTDDSWAKKELIKVQQSNRRLKEENRLLSESLSFYMSNTSLDSQAKNYNSPLQSSNQNINSKFFPNYFTSSNSSYDNWNPRPRVTRSKSVQEYERRNILRNNYRTRSMSYHNYQHSSLADTKPSVSTHGTRPQANIPRIRRKNTLNLPVSSTVRGIQRRTSMPERTLSENNRSVAYRSNSFRNTYTRKPFNSLPSDAFY